MTTEKEKKHLQIRRRVYIEDIIATLQESVADLQKLLKKLLGGNSIG